LSAIKNFPIISSDLKSAMRERELATSNLRTWDKEHNNTKYAYKSIMKYVKRP